MRKINEGFIRGLNELIISPGFSFQQFKNTKIYENQDAIRTIYLEGQYIIENRKYMVSLFFRNRIIYLVS